MEVALGFGFFSLGLLALGQWQLRSTLSTNLMITGYLLDRVQQADGEIERLQERVKKLEGWSLPDYTDWANLTASESSSDGEPAQTQHAGRDSDEV